LTSGKTSRTCSVTRRSATTGAETPRSLPAGLAGCGSTGDGQPRARQNAHHWSPGYRAGTVERVSAGSRGAASRRARRGRRSRARRRAGTVAPSLRGALICTGWRAATQDCRRARQVDRAVRDAQPSPDPTANTGDTEGQAKAEGHAGGTGRK